MKKVFLLLVLFLVGVAVFVTYTFDSVFRHEDQLSIKTKEKDNSYEIRAYFHRAKTKMIQRYMDRQLGANALFENSRMDGKVTLDNNSTFYVKTRPGYVYIRMKKNENDSSALAKIKELDHGIRERLATEL
ncbi:hypothetical protein GWC95_01330 [Sediminibacterium roseum]|uniref:Uncharacterized protein n=1 Tax=Sediminibacterium roseum TaxID=1978412 RepID=A0ABW9ZTY0_9BACT|nr:hypothetical protein [Sediminibacterium roseum]NCI48545.1 hypothetical protein [Sediminibacterium roseum]